MAGKGNFENQLVLAAGEEAVKTAKALLKADALTGAWRDAAGKLHGVFAGADGERAEVAVTTGEHMTGECTRCGSGVCGHAAALVMYAGRFPQREKEEALPVYYGGLRTQPLPKLIERARRSGAELSIQAQSAAPHAPSKWESITMRVRLCEAGRERAGNLNNLRELYFDKTLNVVMHYEDFSLQEQQIIRFLALYGKPDGAGIALDSELTAELFHSLVGFPRFFRDGKALAIRGERAEPALLDNGKKLFPGVLVDGAPLAVSAVKVIAGRSGCWVGCDRDYFFVPGKCEIGYLRSFFRSGALDKSAAECANWRKDLQLPVLKIRDETAPATRRRNGSNSRGGSSIPAAGSAGSFLPAPAFWKAPAGASGGGTPRWKGASNRRWRSSASSARPTARRNCAGANGSRSSSTGCCRSSAAPSRSSPGKRSASSSTVCRSSRCRAPSSAAPTTPAGSAAAS